MLRANVMLILLWLVALILAGWVLGQLPLAAIMQSVKALSVWQGLAWVGVNLGVIALLTRRWQLLTDVLEQPPGFYPLLAVRQAGQALSFLTPGPQFGGEPLQVYWLWKRFGLKIKHAILGLGLDRFFELWVNFSVLVLALLYLLATTVTVVQNGQAILLTLLLLLAALSCSGWVLLQQPSWITRILQKLTWPWRRHQRLQQVDTHWQAMASDLARIAREEKPALFKAFLLSLGGWGAMLAELCLLLVILDVALDFPTLMVILVATRLAFLLPLPGAIGTLEAAIFWSFQVIDLPPAAALGMIALMRLRDAVILLVGLFFMRRLHSDN